MYTTYIAYNTCKLNMSIVPLLLDDRLAMYNNKYETVVTSSIFNSMCINAGYLVDERAESF